MAPEFGITGDNRRLLILSLAHLSSQFNRRVTRLLNITLSYYRLYPERFKSLTPGFMCFFSYKEFGFFIQYIVLLLRTPHVRTN